MRGGGKATVPTICTFVVAWLWLTSSGDPFKIANHILLVEKDPQARVRINPGRNLKLKLRLQAQHLRYPEGILRSYVPYGRPTGHEGAGTTPSVSSTLTLYRKIHRSLSHLAYLNMLNATGLGIS